MGESVAVAKEVDAEKSSSPTRSSSKSIHRVQKEHEMQLGSLGGVIGNIRSNGGTPSADGIATQLSGMHIAQRAPALLALQHTHGNRYVQRVVAGIQAKLVVGQPGDKYEQEADRVADEVMRMPEPRVQRQVEEEEEDLIQTKPLVNQITPFVQRQVEEEEEILQTKKREGTTPEVTHDLESSINALKGGGQPLAESTRNFFEPRFGYNFSDVRVHTDAKAGESAQAVNALAFTMGRDIVFGMGEYALETSGGLRLLAHELTHVQQQTGKNQSKIIQASPGNEKLNIGDTENETNALIKNASDVIERGGGVAKFEYLPADLEWESSFIWFDDSHVQKLYRYLFKKWFGVTGDESLDTTPDLAVPPRWVGEFRAKALNVRPQKTGNNDDPAYREEKQLADLAVKLADSIAPENLAQEIRRGFVEEADTRVGTPVLSLEAIAAIQSSMANFSTCITFFTQVTNKVSGTVKIKNPLPKGLLGYNETNPVMAENIPSNAWVSCTPNMKARPKPGDPLIFTYAEAVKNKSGETKHWKGNFAHVSILRSIEPIENTLSDDVAKALARECKQTNGNIEKWISIDGGGTTVTEVTRYFCPDSCIIRGTADRTVSGWIDIEKVVDKQKKSTK